MNKAVVAGMFLLSTALFVGCGSTAAPNPTAPQGGTAGIAADGRAQTKAIGPLQWVPTNQQNIPLQTKVQSIPGAEHAHVYVNGQNAFVVLNYMVSDGPDAFPTDKSVPSHGTTRDQTNLVRTPSDTGPTGTGMYMVHPSIYGTSGMGLHAERPHYTDGAKESPQKGSKAGVTNTNGTTPLHQRISETILNTDPSIHNVYFVQQMR